MAQNAPLILQNPNTYLASSACTLSVSNPKRKFKVIIVGDGGIGKTSYIERLNNGNFRKEYIATMGIEKHEIVFSTSCGEFTIEMCDTAGQEKLGPLRDVYYENIDAAILVFDVSSRVTYKNIPNWHRDILRVCKEIPLVLCANKIDISLRKISSKSIKYHVKYGMKMFEISVKDKINLKEPIQYLLQQLVKEPTLTLLDSIGSSQFHDVNKLSLSC